MIEARSNEVDQDIQYVREYLCFCRSVIFRQDMLNDFVKFLNFLSQKPYLIDANVKKYLKEFIGKKELASYIYPIITERANIICDYDTLFDFDVNEINKLSQKLRVEEEYFKFQEKHNKSNKLNEQWCLNETACALVYYHYGSISRLLDTYKLDKVRESIKLIVKTSEAEKNDDSLEILLDERVYPLALIRALELQGMTNNLIEYVKENLHQNAIANIGTLSDIYIEFTSDMMQDLAKIENKIEIRIDPKYPKVLNIKIDFYRNYTFGQKAFNGSYTIEIEDLNQEHQKDMEKIDVKMMDFQLRPTENFYPIFLKNKIKFLLEKIINKERLTQKDRKDIQVILLSYLKLENCQKILSINPTNIEDINILYLLLSQGYILEACEGLKNKKLSPRENIKFKILLNTALSQYYQHAGAEEYVILLEKLLGSVNIEIKEIDFFTKKEKNYLSENVKKLSRENHRKKIEAFWPSPPADKKPLSIVFTQANKPLDWWLVVSEKIMPNFILNNFSIFQPIFDKKSAKLELEETSIDEYLVFLKTTNNPDVNEIWQEKAFLSKAKNVVETFADNAKMIIESKIFIHNIEPLCSRFLKLAYLAKKNKNQNKDFEGLEKQTSDFLKDIFLSIKAVVVEKSRSEVYHEMDFERLELFKKILKSDEFFSLFNEIIDFGKKSPEIEKMLPGLEANRLSLMKETVKEYSEVVLKWVEIYKDPELIQLIFKRPALLELVDNEALIKIVDIVRQTSTPVPQLNAILVKRRIIDNDADKMKAIKNYPLSEVTNTGSLIKLPSIGVRRVIHASSQRENFLVMREAMNIFLSINNIDVASKNSSDNIIKAMALMQLEQFKQMLNSDEFFLLFNKMIEKKSISPKTQKMLMASEEEKPCLVKEGGAFNEYSGVLLKWIQTYCNDPEFIQLILKRSALLELVDNITLIKITNIVKQTLASVPQQLNAILDKRGIIFDNIDARIREKKGSPVPDQMREVKSNPLPISKTHRDEKQSEASHSRIFVNIPKTKIDGGKFPGIFQKKLPQKNLPQKKEPLGNMQRRALSLPVGQKNLAMR